MPAPPEVIDAAAEESAAEHEALLDALMAELAALWLVYGGPSLADRARWRRESVPVIRAAAQAAASQAAGAASLQASLSLDLELANVAPDLGPTWRGAPGRNPRFDEVARQIESHVESPGIASAWHLSEGLSFDEAMDEAAGRAVKLAVGDTNRAYSEGFEHGIEQRGVKVERYLKVPNPNACKWCFAVAARGYKSPQTIPRHTNCKCSHRAVFAVRQPSGLVRNKDWQAALDQAGYGDLILAYRNTPQKNALVASRILEAIDLEELVPRVGAR